MSPSYVKLSEDLLALWALFLLILLGGPDTITAFSLEDNALWLRHLIGLIAQVFAFFYIFVKTLPDNKLMGSVVLVFATGVIKYGERTRPLYLASLESFKESTIKLPNHGDSVDLASVEPDKEEDSDLKLVRVFHFYQIFKGLIVNIMSNHSQRLESREFFLEQDADSAFKFMSTELNLLYKVFYTKIMAVNSSWGVVIRNIAFYMSVTALVLFCINKKEDYIPPIFGSPTLCINDDRDASESVLIDSCYLANLLAHSERKWEVICGVWVELLSYAASLGIGRHFPKI